MALANSIASMTTLGIQSLVKSGAPSCSKRDISFVEKRPGEKAGKHPHMIKVRSKFSSSTDSTTQASFAI